MKRDIRKFNVFCGNEIFQKVEEYRRLELGRLLHPYPLSALLPYVPSMTDPVKIICFNFHIFQDANGEGNYLESELSRLRQILDWVNQHYQYPEPQSDAYPPAQPLQDTRIRFEINRVEYYKDQTLFTSSSIGALQAAAVARNPTTLDQLNVYVTNGYYIGAAAFAAMPSSSPGFDSFVVLLGGAASQANPLWLDSDYVHSSTLAHEFGHVLDLPHTYAGGGASANCTQDADFLSDVFGFLPSTCPHVCSWAANPSTQEPLLPNTVITNNLMGGNHDNYWVSNLQAGVMHRALTEKSVKRYVATGCRDCASCVAFTVHGVDHTSQGGDASLSYGQVLLNKSWGWAEDRFVTPISGIYHFDASFVKNAYNNAGVDGDLLMTILNNGNFVGRAWSGGGSGMRGTGCVSLNTYLARGDVITTVAQSVEGVKRNFAEYYFSGHLICSCC